MDEPTRMRTPRLGLRLLQADRPGDEALFVHLYTDPVVMRHIAPISDAEAAVRSFKTACRHNERHAPGHRFWRIDWQGGGSGAPAEAGVGGVGLAALQREGDSAELGVMLREGWWNRGVSSEAFTVVLAHAFGPMGLALVHAERPDDDHARVIDRLLDRFGFRRTPERASAPGQCRWELQQEGWLGPSVL